MEYKFTVSPREPGTDILIAQLNEYGFDSFEETETGVNAYIPSELCENDFTEKISVLNNEDFIITFQKSELQQKNWNELWEKSFNPVIINDTCCIRASFHEINENYRFDIVINPKMSFGTGHHETTALMAEEMMLMNFENKKVADAGCGTAVLSILAAKMNANTVFAFDIDDWAVENSKENIALNNCGNIDVYKGDAALLREKLFNVILANINKNILLADIANYASSLLVEGELLLSGFFVHDKKDLLKEAVKHKLLLIAERENKNWSLLHFKKEL